MVGLTALLLLASCGPRKAATQTPATPTADMVKVTKVRAVLSQSGVLSANRTAGATLSPARESQVAATASGKVLGALVQEGSRVSAGQTVLQLDPANAQTNLANAQVALQTAQVNLERSTRSTEASVAPLKAALQAAQANLEVAQRKYLEGQQLFKAGAIAQLDLTGLEAAYTQAKAAADNAKEALDKAGRASSEDLALLRLQITQAQNGLDQARRALADTNVKAPFTGVVAQIYVNPGEFVAMGSRVFRLADISKLEAKFRITPSEAARLPIGTGMNLDYGGRTYYATLTRTAQVPGTDRLVEAIAQVAPGSGLSLTPGASAALRYTLKLAQGVLVPSGALVAGDTNQVFVVQEGKAKLVNVQVLGDNGSRMAVSGIPAAAQVVYPVPSGLANGNPVEVVK
ncbi:MAG: HlyD family efflux transporter periplasmic adaptor subunit [Thermaceae bacterium]|nr:HlyD family efflux transporter periplasmic adaptor subunit [Thermaceae bacterium]